MSDDRNRDDPAQGSEGLPGGGPQWSGDDAFSGFGNQTPHRNPQDLGGDPPGEDTQPPAADEGAGGHAVDPGVSSSG
ncbi:MAG TPA: hypothetical protein VF552_08580 [Allosphingosinicella sp.]|jgi:hypothetical protein